MLIYNVTVNVDEEVHEEWLEWMRSSHIPKVMDTGLFVDYRILRLLNDEPHGGINYAVQYSLHDMQAYHTYVERHAPSLQAEHRHRYENRTVAFRTLLEVV